MKGDIALAGFLLTEQEWFALDAVTRAQMLAAALERETPWVATHLSEMLSGPIELDPKS
jgi:hypothetical protein